MVRDGRATVHSIITRKVTITGFDLKSYRQSLTKWNSAISAMNDQCEELGPNYCLKVYYEQLILHPRTWLTKILKFLDLPWTEEVMHHEKQINKPHGISLSKVERSSDQVKKISFEKRFALKKCNKNVIITYNVIAIISNNFATENRGLWLKREFLGARDSLLKVKFSKKSTPKRPIVYILNKEMVRLST